MISLLVILSLLSLSAAEQCYKPSPKCTQCTSDTQMCDGPSESCPPDHACGYKYTAMISGPHTASTLERTCIPLSQCDFASSISTVKEQTRIIFSCCINGDDCRPDYRKLLDAERPQTVNGLVCSGCPLTDFRCRHKGPIQCRDGEVMCFHLTTSISDSVEFEIEGCATQSFCDRGNKVTEFHKEEIICTKATEGGINRPLCPTA